MADGYLQVTTTTETRDGARRLARSVVQARLAACVQILGPIESLYWWQDEIEEAGEWMCLMKTTVDTYPALEALILDAHPYETPEITASPITGSPGYLNWIGRETSP